jgi:hypothetical protein
VDYGVRDVDVKNVTWVLEEWKNAQPIFRQEGYLEVTDNARKFLRKIEKIQKQEQIGIHNNAEIAYYAISLVQYLWKMNVTSTTNTSGIISTTRNTMNAFVGLPKEVSLIKEGASLIEDAVFYEGKSKIYPDYTLLTKTFLLAAYHCQREIWKGDENQSPEAVERLEGELNRMNEFH